MEGNKSEAKRQTPYDFSHVWYMRKEKKKKNIKKMNKPIHTHTHTHTHKHLDIENRMVPRGERRGR